MAVSRRLATPKFTLPNIFPLESRDIASRLYAGAIPRDHPADALPMLRQIRKHARSANLEFEALLNLGRTEEAWRQVRRQCRDSWPRRWRWPVERRARVMGHFVHYAEVPAAYFSGRYRYAARALEAFLNARLRPKRSLEPL